MKPGHKRIKRMRFGRGYLDKFHEGEMLYYLKVLGKGRPRSIVLVEKISSVNLYGRGLKKTITVECNMNDGQLLTFTARLAMCKIARYGGRGNLRNKLVITIMFRRIVLAEVELYSSKKQLQAA